ncbi:MAG TPA: DUF3592 domain-containing protein [Pyrinomonadaceae bacterium]|nr:DUF3592 domain-containing protein [Pyrinomonadaceae bacterium]
MGILDRILHRRQAAVSDRRSQLLAHGRITDGVILDCEINETGHEVVVYMYTLNGVDFESSDILTEDQRSDRLKYAPGAKVGIRYDPRNQGNSIVE